MAQRWVDLSQEYHEDMPPGKSRPEHAFRIKTLREVDKDGRGVHSEQFTFLSHQGTHVDAPKHVLRDGASIDEIPLERFVGTAAVLDIPKEAFEPITAVDLENAKPEVKKGDIVVIRTGWGERMWHSDDYLNCPYVTLDAAEWLFEKGIKMLGVDTNTVDLPIPLRTEGFDFPIHKFLIGNDILIVENLGNLSAVSGKRVMIAAFPLKIMGADGSPTRVVAFVD